MGVGVGVDVGEDDGSPPDAAMLGVGDADAAAPGVRVLDVVGVGVGVPEGVGEGVGVALGDEHTKPVVSQAAHWSKPVPPFMGPGRAPCWSHRASVVIHCAAGAAEPWYAVEQKNESVNVSSLPKKRISWRKLGEP